MERRRRQPGVVPQAPALRAAADRSSAGAGAVPYAELHCHSNFCFLDGASHPEELAEEAARLGLEALALTDHDGFYGVVRFAEAARAVGLPTVFGAELTLGATDARRTAWPTPRATTCSCWPTAPRATPRLAARHQPWASWRGRRARRASRLDGAGRATASGHWCGAHRLPQGRGAGRARRRTARPPPAASCSGWSTPSGATACAVELWDHGDPLDSARNDALAELAARHGVDLRRHQQRALRHARRAARWPPRSPRCGPGAASTSSTRGCPAAAGAHLRSGAEQARRFARYPGVVEAAAELGRACAFDLALVAPDLPPFPCPPRPRRDELAARADRGEVRDAALRAAPAPSAMPRRLWPASSTSSTSSRSSASPATSSIVWDIVEFCRRADIFCQGRGSAANSAVCYALGITKADAVSLGLLFERFLSPERDGPPDIDIDIESDRREEVIQYVYERLRPRARRPGRQRHHLPGQVGGARHGQGARLRHRPAGRVVASRSTRWGPVEATARAARSHDIPAAGARARRAGRGLPPPPRHPLGRHGASATGR